MPVARVSGSVISSMALLFFISGMPSIGGEQTPAPAAPEKANSFEQALFEELPVVEAATLRQQTLEEAPANVTVVSATEIRQRGYRTLADVLADVRGFYVTNDRTYRFVGTRGLSIPGDYNTRFLVMINGHPMTENIYNSNGFFGQDFGLDMDLVQRIEIIRGPTSALYGSNGILANINIITKSPVDVPAFSVTTELGSFGQGKTQMAASRHLGRGANLLLSFSGFHTRGQSLYFPDFDSPETNDGRADRVDNERGYHSFAQLLWGNWTATAYFNSRQVHLPYGAYGSVFNDPGNIARDGRNFLGVGYSRDVGERGKLRWRLNYDQYRYYDRYHYRDESEDFTTVLYDKNLGDWINGQMSFSRPLPGLGELTVGGSGALELRNFQLLYLEPAVPDGRFELSRPDRRGALFATQEWEFRTGWTAHLGLRQDFSSNFGGAISPRLALVRRHSSRTTSKLVYSRAFRNPSTFEKYWADPTYLLRNPELNQERAHTFEGVVERTLGKNVRAVVNTFHYRLGNVIQAEFLDDGMQQYRNTARLRTTGVETEWSGRFGDWLNAGGSTVFQRALDASEGLPMPNSPRFLAKGYSSIPVARRKLFLHTSVLYLGHRLTGYGEQLAPVALFDFTASTNRLHPSYDVVFGLRNLFNRRYEDPIDLLQGRMPANGRHFFVKLVWRTAE
jgi:outer membrane receptor for ferrienterochelin and colicins